MMRFTGPFLSASRYTGFLLCVIRILYRGPFPYYTRTHIHHSQIMKHISAKYRQLSSHYHGLLERNLINELWPDFCIVYNISIVLVKSLRTCGKKIETLSQPKSEIKRYNKNNLRLLTFCVAWIGNDLELAECASMYAHQICGIHSTSFQDFRGFSANQTICNRLASRQSETLFQMIWKHLLVYTLKCWFSFFMYFCKR